MVNNLFHSEECKVKIKVLSSVYLPDFICMYTYIWIDECLGGPGI